MTTRRWMVLITLVASILAGGVLLNRRSHFLRMADRHRPLAKLYSHRRQVMLDSDVPLINESFFDANGDMKPEVVEWIRPRHEYYAGLVEKYEYAADHPWVGVEDDPPAPK